MSRLLSCMCSECRYVTALSGRAYGRKDGVEIPLQLGDIKMNGRIVSRTNMAGAFRFEIPLGINRAVVMFSDSHFNKLLDVTKIVQIKEGSETTFNVILPIMPEPVHFDSTNGTEISIGEGTGSSAAGSVKIAKNSLTDSEGNPYIGNAKVKVHFTDPRDMDSIDAVNGQFETESESGEKVPLRTYGVVGLQLHDENGNELRVNKPMRISIDSDAIKIPLDENGNPKANIWAYDHNKGNWVDMGRLQASENTDQTAARRLLQKSTTFFIDTMPNYIPQTELEKTITYWTNCDHSVQLTRKEPKDGACYVSVSVYSDPFYREPYQGNDVTINAYVYEQGSFTSKSSVSVLQNGHACVEMFCNKNVTISVERGNEKFVPKIDHYLPEPINSSFTNIRNQYVSFDGFDLRDALDCSAYSGYKPETKGQFCHGPVYAREHSYKCNAVKAQDASFMFQFSAPYKPPTRTFAEGEQTYDKRLSWYSIPPSSNRFRSCFIKLRIEVSNRSFIKKYFLRYLKLNTTTSL